MAKECHVCKNISATDANYCIKCGNEFSDKELSGEDLLRVELSEAKKTIQGLNSALVENAKMSKLLKMGIASGTEISRLEKQLRVTGKNKITHRNVWVFFMLVSITLGITTTYFYNESNSWRWRSYDLDSQNYSLDSELKKQKKEIQDITNKNKELQSELSILKPKAPVTYKVISEALYYYKNECSVFTETNCKRLVGGHETIYIIENEYGLTKNGWIKMQNLEKQ